jgi:putative aldouronate transport system permease protein
MVRKRESKQWMLFLMLVPALVYFILFQYIPMSGILLAFKQYSIRDGFLGSPWVGFSNFKFLWISGQLWRITRNTVLYNLAFIITTHATAIFVAVFISGLAGKKTTKTIHSVLFLPYFISFVVLGVFVYNILSYEFGSLNTFLKAIDMEPINAYAKPLMWPLVLTFFNMWKWVGYSSIIYLAVIVAIDKQAYEAAQIEGATVWKQVWYITIPHLVPTFIIILLLQLGKIMRGQFDLFYNIIGNNSQLFDATDVIDTYVFRSLVHNFDIGMGSAAGLYQSALGLVIILLVNWLIRRVHPDYALF